MSGLISSPSNAISGKGVSASQLESWNSGLVPSSFIRGQNYESGTTIPKAYINYIFLDDQFRYVGGGASRVGNYGEVKQHWSELSNLAAQKNGYLLVYVSNESNFTVYFDNLQVVHKPGPIVEETHYYPFGLVMNGISSKALNNAPVNKKKFNGIEHTTEFDLNTYDAFFRNVDPQIGRWWQIDPKPNEMQSLYSMIGNDPIRFADPLGDTLRFTSAQIQNQSTVNNVTADLQRATGLTLSIDANGNLTYATTTNSKGRQEATISKDANGKNTGSKSARKDLMKALNSRKTVDVFAQNNIGSKGGGLQVNIDAIQVNKFIAGTSSDLNNFTQGFGMTFLHELQHTDIFGGKSDPAKQIVNGQVGVPFGDIGGPETRMNKVRRELNQQGMNLGQRLSYGPLPMGTSGMVYLPFSNRSLNDINSGTIPTSMMISYIP
jgi:RHS repeat-associated protein